MGMINDIKTKLSDAYNVVESTPGVGKALEMYNTWRNTQSNLFSEDANNLITNNNLIPDVVKDRYSSVRNVVQDATLGIAGSAALTTAFRHQKIINKGIDIGVGAVTKAGSFVNNRIDDFVEEMHEEKPDRGYENIVKEPSDEDVAFSY